MKKVGLRKMELIFLFINQTEQGFIEGQGFNFSPNYKFEVAIEGNVYILKQSRCDKKIPKLFFDDTGCISNVTAIVGENGSGKSTLLHELSHLFFSVKDEDHVPAYNDYFAERYTKEMRVAVFMENGEFVCYHNIDRFKNETGMRNVYLYQGSPIFQKMVVNNEGCENISKIYLTNSMYSIENNLSTNGCIDRILLNVEALKTLKSKFYEGNINKNHFADGEYFSYIDLCQRQKTTNDFQQILDILYIGAMYARKDKGILSKNLHPDLYVSFEFYTDIIQDKLYRVKRKRKQGEGNEDILIKAHRKLKSIIGDSFIEILKTDSICIAYINLLYEIIAYKGGNGFSDIGVIHSKDDLKSSIEYILRYNDGEFSLFGNAFNEIKEFEECFWECPQTGCLLPVDDAGYDSKIEVKYGSDSYKRFLKLMEKYAIHRKHSFILKYIRIGGLQFSSGERALLNFFSWLHLVPFFKYISDDVQESLKDNVLLLIDEIDLNQ